MNVEKPNFENSLPLGVRPTGDSGVYLVRSNSRPGKQPWRVDVTVLQCNCERATLGIARQSANRNGGSPKYEDMCQHLKKALAYDAIALRIAGERAGWWPG